MNIRGNRAAIKVFAEGYQERDEGRGGRRAPEERVRGGACEATDAATAAAVEKAGRLLLLFNPSGKLNGGGQADNNESSRRNEHRDRNCICTPNEIIIIIIIVISNRRSVDIHLERDFRFFEKDLFSVLFLRRGADNSCCDDKYVATAVKRFYER
ncbi:hypothetical protein QTP88_008192 [Uroleucon formosanum]